ncbi:glycosyltransferase family 4 protein [Gottfriedia acidiceleris]|uniref:glycosyltransferase family 4 protein n=1 Tax=Gottfriedia acidiceleris TaxID=371036 RepID=UPI003D1C156E
MKILMVCTENLPVPPVLGGAIQTYIAGSLPYLSKVHNITILGVNDPSLPDEETIDGVHYVRVPGKVLELYREGVVRYIEGNQFDLIHIFNRPRLVLPIRKVAPEAKITLSMHNDMFNIGKIDVDEANLVVEEVSRIVTVSDYVGNVIRELYPQSANKISTIYSGVDSDRFLPGNDSRIINTRDTLRREFGLENKTVILFAGRLSENKGVDRLVRALPTLSKSFNNLALVIVGSNWFSQNHVTDYVAYIRAISKRQDVPIITTGFVSPFEIQNWFAVADLFVCTSLWQEPLARVHYEAMAAGLPIVTTARGGNPEVIIPGENGLIVENPEDPNEFATKITEILSNKTLMKNMGRKGRELAVSKYLWNRVADDILSVWQQAEFNSSISSEQLEQFESKAVSKSVVPNLEFAVMNDTNNNSEAKVNEEIKVEKTKTNTKTKTKSITETKVNEEVKVEKTKTKTKSITDIKSMEEVLVAKSKSKSNTESKTMEEVLVEKARSIPREKLDVSELTANPNPMVLKRIRKVTEKVTINEKVNEVTNLEIRSNEQNSGVNAEQKKLKRITSVIDLYLNKTV